MQQQTITSLPDSRPLRIIHIASGDLWAGAEVQLYHLAKALHSADNLHLKVVLLNYGELHHRLKEKGIDVNVINEKQYGIFRLFIEFKSIAQKFQPDIIHTHRYKENILGSLTGILLPHTRSM